MDRRKHRERGPMESGPQGLQGRGTKEDVLFRAVGRGTNEK